jgi:hypothetical protein
MNLRLFVLAALGLLAAVPPRSADAARCRTIIPRSSLSCTDGDPTCDLDGRRDGRCIIALCDTGSADAPRPTFCAGSLTWSTLSRGKVGRSFVARAGRCPVSKRRVFCRPVADPPGTQALERTCTLSVDAPKVSTGRTTTRCRIEAVRFERQLGHVTARLSINFPDVPFRARGQHGWLDLDVLSPLDVGVFAFGDPARPLSNATGVLGGESIPIKLDQARLQIDELSRAATIWTDDLHGTLDIEQSGGPFDPRRVVLHLEF